MKTHSEEENKSILNEQIEQFTKDIAHDAMLYFANRALSEEEEHIIEINIRKKLDFFLKHGHYNMERKMAKQTTMTGEDKSPDQCEQEGGDNDIEKCKKENDGYVYGEAFCLMKYKCQKCETIETLWNSRDGVTPFVIDCIRCNDKMRHIDWEGDKKAINHTPYRNQRVFVGFPMELAKLYARKWADLNWNDKDCPMSETYKTKEQAVKELIKERSSEEPYIILW